MRVIGVVDLRGGRAVHARGGARGLYPPVETVAGMHIDPGDPLRLARIYVDCLGVVELYAADLDAIAGRAPQNESIGSIAALGVPLCVDAAVSTPERALHLFAAGVGQVVVGLETLPSWSALRAVCDVCGRGRVVFSLDMRGGEPLVAANGIRPDGPPEWYATCAAEAGVGAMIVLDLGRVGSGLGPNLGVLTAVRHTVPHLRLLAGGGIRDAADLMRLANAGCDGALVATALHRGRIGASDIHQLTRHKGQITNRDL